MSKPQEPMTAAEYAKVNASWLEDTRDVQPVGLINLSDVVEWVRENLEPGDVFSETQLRRWAYENDFTPERPAVAGAGRR